MRTRPGRNNQCDVEKNDNRDSRGETVKLCARDCDRGKNDHKKKRLIVSWDGREPSRRKEVEPVDRKG